MERSASEQAGDPQDGLILGPTDGLVGSWSRVRPEGGRSVRRFLAGPTETAGAYGTFEEQSGPGGGVRPHIHPGGEEAFFVVEGELVVLLGERIVHAPAGSFIRVPRGTVHAFRNDGDRPARYLVTLSPGDVAAFFQEMSVLLGRQDQLTPDAFAAERAAVFSRHASHTQIQWVERDW